MARYVVLYFEDNTQAEEYVESGLHATDPDAYYIVAMFGVPTQFCECPKIDPPGTVGGRQGGRSIARGAKLGWWVHAACGKPTQYSYQSPKNLLTVQGPAPLKPQWTFIATPERPHPAALVRSQDV